MVYKQSFKINEFKISTFHLLNLGKNPTLLSFQFEVWENIKDAWFQMLNWRGYFHKADFDIYSEI